MNDLNNDLVESVDQDLISAPVKLVIWDLDDTFWHGTLSEEAIVPSPSNIELVKLLATRGIVSSICSKNDYDAVEKQLKSLDMWNYFVLPMISFQAKGSGIANIIRALQLRAENVIFIDDNPTVLAEAKFSCPGLMCLSSPHQLEELLADKNLKGKSDPDLSQLEQYQIIARKFDKRYQSNISEEAFLKQSGIKVCIDYDIDPHMERIIELVNRSNQLNYTKVRVETEEEKAAFSYCLKAFGYNAGIVKVSDNYGDYGIVGFFVTLAFLGENKLEHFVFSCRVMNMGIEQYVYQYLNRPVIEIKEPVANPIESFEKIDWIEQVSTEETIFRLRDLNLVLIGGCEMLQVSTYCSCHSLEFTNRDVRGLIKRLDDPFFILADSRRSRDSELSEQLPVSSAYEVAQLHGALRTADAVVVSFYRMMEPNYFRTRDGLTFRLDEDALTAILKSDQAIWFTRNFTYADFSHEELNDLIALCFDRLASSTKSKAKIVVFLEETRKLDDNPSEYNLKNMYNEFVIKQCARIDKLRFVDQSRVVDAQWLHDDGFHMSRQGYYQLAQAVLKVIDN